MIYWWHMVFFFFGGHILYTSNFLAKLENTLKVRALCYTIFLWVPFFRLCLKNGINNFVVFIKTLLKIKRGTFIPNKKCFYVHNKFHNLLRYIEDSN